MSNIFLISLSFIALILFIVLYKKKRELIYAILSIFSGMSLCIGIVFLCYLQFSNASILKNYVSKHYENVMNFHAPEKGKGSFVSNGNVYQIEETKDANNNTIIRIIPPTQKDVVTVTLSDMQED